MSGSEGRKNVTVWIPMMQFLGYDYKLKSEHLQIKTWSCLTLIIFIDYSFRIPELKNKHTHTLNFPQASLKFDLVFEI